MKAWYKFTAKDVPMFIRTSQIILANRPRSPILQANTIQVGCDDLPDIYSNNNILADGQYFKVIWLNGLIAANGDVVKPLYTFKSIECVGANLAPDDISCKLKFVNESNIYTMQNLLGMDGSKVVASDSRTFLPQDLHLALTWLKDGEPMVASVDDTFLGEQIQCYKGAPVIPVDAGLYDFTRNNVITGGLYE